MRAHFTFVLTKEDKSIAYNLFAFPYMSMLPEYTSFPESINDILDYLVYRFKNENAAPKDAKLRVHFCPLDNSFP